MRRPARVSGAPRGRYRPIRLVTQRTGPTHTASKTLGLVTFIAAVLAIVAASSPAGNAIVSLLRLSGPIAGVVWAGIAGIAGTLTWFSYLSEKRDLERITL